MTHTRTKLSKAAKMSGEWKPPHFFNLLKRERIPRKVYRTRDEARRDVFDHIEMFYNPTRKHARNGMLSPIEFERQHKAKVEDV